MSSIFRLLPFLFIFFTVQQARAQVSDLEVLGTYETTYSTNGIYVNRAHNIRTAVSIITEAAIVIPPEATVSFNELVGERTRRRGFREAPVIVEGRMTEGYGGGICQVASTVYAAAMYSGLTIVEHWRHSRTSAYIPAGLDATVDWGTKDLILQNPYPFPIYLFVRTREASDREEIITAEFRGLHRVFDVNISLEETIISRFRTIVEVDPELEPGTRDIVERGTRGVRVLIRRRFVPIDLPDGTIVEEETTLTYPASSRIIHVGPPISDEE